MENTGYAYSILIIKSEEKRRLRRLDTDGRIMLKEILKK
jgi:hypothetical protein